MHHKFISIDITPNSDSAFTANGGVMWEHNATSLKFTIAPELVGDYRYYIEYRSLMGTKVRTEYLELSTEDNTVIYDIPVSMSSLKGVECYFNIVSIDGDGNTVQIIKPKKFCLTFDYSPDTDNYLSKVNDFSINALLEAIRLGTFKGEKGEKGDVGEKGEKGDTGGISEDYATKNFANALKSKLCGEAVTADDVSPIEHEISVRIKSKNLFDISKITDTNLITNNGDGTLTVNTYFCPSRQSLREVCPNLKVGDVATLSLATQSTMAKFIYLAALGTTWSVGKSITITEDMLNSNVTFYGFAQTETGYETPAVISNIQIELGETATEYTPYIDPQTVNVTSCGKNTFDYTKWINAEESEFNGVKCLKVSDGGNISYTYTVEGGSNIAYTLTCRVFRESGSEEKGTNIVAKRTDGTERNLGVSIRHDTVFTGIVYGGETLFFRGWNLPLYIDLTVTQLEMGEIATEFEEHKAVTVTANADGSVAGLVSVSPNMTLFTDANGVTIECEYNKDINKSIEKIITAVKSLGGTF